MSMALAAAKPFLAGAQKLRACSNGTQAKLACKSKGTYQASGGARHRVRPGRAARAPAGPPQAPGRRNVAACWRRTGDGWWWLAPRQVAPAACRPHSRRRGSPRADSLPATAAAAAAAGPGGGGRRRAAGQCAEAVPPRGHDRGCAPQPPAIALPSLRLAASRRPGVQHACCRAPQAGCVGAGGTSATPAGAMHAGPPRSSLRAAARRRRPGASGCMPSPPGTPLTPAVPASLAAPACPPQA